MNKGGYVSVASLTISDIIKELKLLMRWANFSVTAKSRIREVSTRHTTASEPRLII